MAKKENRKYKFTSKYHNYIKYVRLSEDKEVKVQFKNGLYETENPEIAEALRKDIYVRDIQ